MRYLKNKPFKKDMKDHGLDDDYLIDVLDDIHDGRATPLGSKLYKIRAARKGEGKSGGFRNFFFWKKGELIVFCLFYFAEYPAACYGDEGESRTLRSSNTKRSEVFERSRVGYSASKNEPSRTSAEIPRSLLRGGSLFGKNEQENLDHDEKQVLRILSEEYDGLTEAEIEQNISNKQWEVIKYD